MGRGEKKQKSAAHANERKDWRLIQSDAGQSKLCYFALSSKSKEYFEDFFTCRRTS